MKSLLIGTHLKSTHELASWGIGPAWDIAMFAPVAYVHGCKQIQN